MPNNIRISLKIDTLENWNNSSLILQNGEVAFIQMPNGTTKIKIGDGINVVKQLPYINELEFFTKELSTQQLNIGLQNKTTTYSSVIGQHLSANSANSTVFGFNAETLNIDQFSFVWNGKNLYGYNNRYKSHGAGTFSLNPENGISGVYIGEDTLASMLNTIYVNGEKTNDFQIINIAQDDYYSLVKSGNTLSNAIYIVSSDMMNMYNERITNLADGISANDAINLNQLCSAISSIDIPEIPTKVSVFENDANYTKLSVDQIPTNSFNVKHISQDEYHSEVLNGADPNTLYIVSSDALNMYGEQIKNLADGEISSDAANLGQVSTLIEIEKNRAIDSENSILQTLSETKNELNYKIDNKVLIDGLSTENFEIKHISQDDYHELVVNRKTDDNKLYIVSSDNINAYGERIINLADGISANDAATYGQLSALKQYHDTSITDIQLIKPEFSNAKIHIRLSAYSDIELSENIIIVDSANQQQYFLGFYNTAEIQVWKICPTDGFGTEYDNCPILIKLVDILKDNSLANKYNKLYIIYEWHYLIDNEDYISDRYSIIVPSYTEVGANASDYITKKQHIELKSEIFKDTYTAEKQENDMYVCYSNKFNVISELLSGTAQILLDSFNKNKQYDIQFKTGDSKVILEFNYEDKINGIEFDDSWNINKNYMFESNRLYIIKIFQDFISVTEDKYNGTISGNLSYKLVNAEPTNSNPLMYNIENRTITTIVVSNSEIPVTVNFPQKIDGYARDFILRIEVTTIEAPEFNFAGLDDSWSVDTEDDEWMFMQPGINIISFTEMK